MCLSRPLSKIAKQAVAKFPNSDVEVGIFFASKVLPKFVGESTDRLVKIGLNIQSLVQEHEENLEAGLDLIVQECELLLSGKVKVPKVTFGKTGLQMPIVTLGCMRFQQQWGPRIANMNQVGGDCQDNLLAILKQAISYGITHIETARGYGCSELQLGVALKQLELTGFVQRNDLIIQTKIPPNPDPKAFREAIELSFKNLQVDYVDLFAFHGMNFEEQYDWVFGKDGNNCLSVVREYLQAGKIRHLGFSTHGSTDFILKCIRSNVFQYVNLHYHYFGSYTASGGGHDGHGNLDCVKLLAEKNMGIFIISPFDKGGRLYAPSNKLRKLCLPEMEPMTFKSQWLWNHHRLHKTRPKLHTYTVGAARPSDLDQPAVAAYLFSTQPDDMLSQLTAVTDRLEMAKEGALGREWVETWWKGLPKNTGSQYQVEHNQIVWLYNMIQAFGMYEFAKARYNSFEKNEEKWDDTLPVEENIEKVGKNGWGFVPGRPLKPDVDYGSDLARVPPENLERVQEAERFVYEWCRSRPEKDEENTDDEPVDDTIVPKEWQTAYDMRPWPDFPDRPARL